MKETTETPSIFAGLGDYELQIMTEFFGGKAKLNGEGSLSAEIAAEIEKVFHEYKKTEVEVGDVIVCVEAGNFGSICIRTVDELREPTTLKYLPRGDYEYISIVTKCETQILWTDFSKEQPYNRQSPFYVPCSWDSLDLMKETPYYREFALPPHASNISFGVYGFHFNEYWNLVRFGACIKADDLEAFVNKLRYFLGKP